MSAECYWSVEVKVVRGPYASSYFPRACYYKKDAERIAEAARKQGCEGVEVKRSNWKKAK